MMLKRFWVLLFLGVLSVGIAGCGGPPAEEVAPPDPTQDEMGEMDDMGKVPTGE